MGETQGDAQREIDRRQRENDDRSLGDESKPYQ